MMPGWWRVGGSLRILAKGGRPDQAAGARLTGAVGSAVQSRGHGLGEPGRSEEKSGGRSAHEEVVMGGERKVGDSNPHATETGGGGRSDGHSLSMFTCPRCRRQFHRSFLERFWSECSQICVALDGSGYRSDCAVIRGAGTTNQVPDQVHSERGGQDVGIAQNSEEGPEIVGACIGDCAYCGDHNRVAVVTSQQVISRCLRCRDEAILTEPPLWCRMRHPVSGRRLGNDDASQSPPATRQVGGSTRSGQ
jgi:hypothetical protein